MPAALNARLSVSVTLSVTVCLNSFSTLYTHPVCLSGIALMKTVNVVNRDAWDDIKQHCQQHCIIIVIDNTVNSRTG